MNKNSTLEKWDNLNLNGLSPNGQWVSYTLFNYEDGDKLFLQNTDNGKTYSFKNPKKSKFHLNNWFSVITDYQTILVNLIKGDEITYLNPFYFDFSKNNQYLVLLKENYLEIINNDNQNTLLKLSDIIEFKLSPSKEQLIYIQKTGSNKKVGFIDFSDLKNSTLTYLKNDYLKMTFNKTGQAVAFFEKKSETEVQLLYFDLIANKNYVLNNFQNYLVHPDGNFILTISDDSEKVFFSVLEKGLINDNKIINQPEIWSGDSHFTFLQDKVFCETHNNNRLAVWFPKSHKIFPITNKNCDKVILSKNKNFAIIFNPKNYEPQFDYVGPVDYYIKNLNTNKDETFLIHNFGNANDMLPSSTDKYVAYFNNENWFIYDIQKNIHKNLTASINTNWKSDINDFNGEIIPFGIAGWANNDNYLILYDKWDIWIINILTLNAKRITNGKENKIKFRLISPFVGKNNSFDGYFGNDLLSSNFILIKAIGSDGKSGYFKWNKDSGLAEIIYNTSKIDQLLHEQEVLVIREQRYDTPPRIVSISDSKITKCLFQSNPHYVNYDKRRVEIINYKSSNGTDLKGLLYFPVNYIANKEYPMIVNVYEKMFEEYHQFHIPTNAASVGFNIPNYTNDGYFILLPDIYYEIGEVGSSATDSVLAAVNKAKEIQSIGKVGLIGHSFGGYETNFIITQTDIFDAAVSSAGVSDVVSYYLNLNWNNGRPDYWRFEYQQWRMGKSFFEDKNQYYRNSPISFAENINTPLLHWSGKKDFHVNWQQSMIWYLALRRLEKKQKLLLYPDEGHILLEEQNKLDITYKVKAWFDFYLKEDYSIDIDKIF